MQVQVLLVPESHTCLRHLLQNGSDPSRNLVLEMPHTHTIVVLTFGIVILYGDDSATSLFGAVDDGLGIDGFDGEGVNDADVDPSLGQLIGCLQGLHQGDAGTDHRHLVAVRLSDNLHTHSTKRRV